MTEPLATFNDVHRVYKTRSGTVAALNGVSITLDRGERVALLGRSGSGKSTLLNLLGGLDRPTSGTIQVADRRLDQLTSDEMAAYRLETVGMVFQSFNLIAGKTARQNVELPFALARETRRVRRAVSLAALEKVGLRDRADHRPAELSGGEQQRVAIARALANGPALLLADEPTGNLDSSTADEIMSMLTQYSTEHQTAVLLVTHDEQLAGDFSHRTLRLHDGAQAE